VLAQRRLAHLVPPYKKALTIAVSNKTTENYLIEPRDFVDIVGEYSEKQSGVSGSYVKVAAQAIEVLSIDNKVTLDPVTANPGLNLNTEGHPNVMWYTLAVTQTEAEHIIFAEGMKRPLQMLLRQRDDTHYMDTPGATKISLLGAEFVDRYIGYRSLFGANIPVEVITEQNKKSKT